MKRGIGLLVLATMLWGGNYICGRYLSTALPATLLNTVRWIISSLFLVAILLLKRERIPLFHRWRELAVLGFFGVFAFSTLTYLGLGQISASQAGMISAGIPIAILAFTPWILKQHVRAAAWIGAIVAVLGVIVLLLGKHTAATGRQSWLGDTEILLAALAWGIYTVLGKRVAPTMGAIPMTAGAAIYGAVFSTFSCIGTVHVNDIHMNPTAWACLLYVSTFASVVAYLAWTSGVEIVGANRAAPYINLLPVWTVVFGVLILGEVLTPVTIAGGVLTILGAVYASRF